MTPNMQICGGVSVDLVVIPEFGVPPYSFFWFNATSINDTVTVSPTVSTFYSVIVTDACGNNFV